MQRSRRYMQRSRRYSPRSESQGGFNESLSVCRWSSGRHRSERSAKPKRSNKQKPSGMLSCDGTQREGLKRKPREGLERKPREGLKRKPREGLKRKPREGLKREPREGLKRKPREGLKWASLRLSLRLVIALR